MTSCYPPLSLTLSPLLRVRAIGFWSRATQPCRLLASAQMAHWPLQTPRPSHDSGTTFRYPRAMIVLEQPAANVLTRQARTGDLTQSSSIINSLFISWSFRVDGLPNRLAAVQGWVVADSLADRFVKKA